MRILLLLVFSITLFKDVYMNTLSGDTADEIKSCCNDRFKTEGSSQKECYKQTVDQIKSSYAETSYADVMETSNKDPKEVEKAKDYVKKSCSQLNSYYQDKTITGKQFGYMIAIGLGDWCEALYPKFLPVYQPNDFDNMMTHKASYWQAMSAYNIDFLDILQANKDLLLEQAFVKYYYFAMNLASNQYLPKICPMAPVISIYKENKDAIAADNEKNWQEVAKKLRIECRKH